MDYNLLLSDVEHYANSYFADNDDEKYAYHNIRHTKNVANAATQIANHYQVNEEDFFVIVASAWFHDLGYFTDPPHHEDEGVRLATSFLEKKQVNKEILQKIAQCIRATHMPQNPHSLPERIVCDADLFHFGTDDFFKCNKRLRKELIATQSEVIDKKQWWEKSIQLLEEHQYKTDYCRLLLNDTKNKNIKKLREKREKLLEKEAAVISGAGTEKKAAKNKTPEKDDQKKEKQKRPDKGIETMFRVTSSNNQRLSNMADNKAHIMITVNSIILSAVISLLLRQLDADPHLAVPTYIILLVCVMTIIFSILATRPKLPAGTFTEEDLIKKDVNLLFFGNFYKMSLETYTAGMWRVMDDSEFLYGSLIRDVYSQGIVLGRKYRLLRISYNIFMYGLIVSVLGYIIVMIDTL